MKKAGGSAKGKRAPRAAGSSSVISLDEIWPQEREVIDRPERLKYVRRLAQPRSCVFCTAAQGDTAFETLKIFSTEFSQVVLNKYPYNTGHLLILPNRHCGDLLDLSEVEYDDLSRVVRGCLSILKRAYTCQGLNLGMNHGAVAGAGIPDHLHWHMIPRWAGDTNFFPLIAETKVLPESLEQTYQRLTPFFEELRVGTSS